MVLPFSLVVLMTVAADGGMSLDDYLVTLETDSSGALSRCTALLQEASKLESSDSPLATTRAYDAAASAAVAADVLSAILAPAARDLTIPIGKATARRLNKLHTRLIACMQSAHFWVVTIAHEKLLKAQGAEPNRSDAASTFREYLPFRQV